VRIAVIVTAVATSAALFGASPGWAQGEVTPGPAIIATHAPMITPGAPPYMEAWLGFSATKSYKGAFTGATVALNPTRNVWTDGFVVRGEAQVGQYDSGRFIGGAFTDDEVLTHGASVMLGYRAAVGGGLLTGYVGANYETHDNDNRAAIVRGTETGFRALVDYYTLLTPYVDFFGMASYSTAFDTAFLFSRVGFKVVDGVWVGPELVYFENESPYREQRVGGFVRFERIFTGGGMSLSAGYANPLHSRPDGWYASLTLDFQFR
jgi:hypothetical protein